MKSVLLPGTSPYVEVIEHLKTVRNCLFSAQHTRVLTLVFP